MEEVKDKERLRSLNGVPELTLKEDKPKSVWNYNDTALAMLLIAIICILGSIILMLIKEAAAAIGSLLTGGVTALSALATGRKSINRQ